MEKQIKEVINYSLADIDEINDRDNRRLYLNADVDESIVETLVYMILKFNRIDKGKPIGEREPIILYINTLGGSQLFGFSIIDAIMQSKTPVYTVNLATCYSMGFLIFLSGSKRYSMQHATFLCHDGVSGAMDSIAKLKDRIEFETGQMEEKVREYVLKRTSITLDLYNSKYRTEWYMYPQEAKQHGIVTHIVGEDCDFDEIL